MDVTWNPWHGCHKLSEGCRNCYVYRMDARYGKDASAVTQNESSFFLPIAKRRNGEYKYPAGTLFYTCFSSDFFVEEADEWRGEIWRMMREREDCDFFLITKRIDRFVACMPDDWGDGYSNVTIAVTTENQDRADDRLPIYLSLPLQKRVIVCEPLLGAIDLRRYLSSRIAEVTVGGESGERARLCDFEWVRALRQQCIDAGVSFHFHQTGARFLKDGRTYRIPKSKQHEQAKRAGLDYEAPKVPNLTKPTAVAEVKEPIETADALHESLSWEVIYQKTDRALELYSKGVYGVKNKEFWKNLRCWFEELLKQNLFYEHNAYVVHHRIVIEPKETFEEIAIHLGVSRQRVSDYETRILKRLRSNLLFNSYEPYAQACFQLQRLLFELKDEEYVVTLMAVCQKHAKLGEWLWKLIVRDQENSPIEIRKSLNSHPSLRHQSLSASQHKKRKPPFSITPEELSQFSYSEKPISLRNLTNRVYVLLEREGVRKLAYKYYKAWLVSINVLEHVIVEGRRYHQTRPTELGKSLGFYNQVIDDGYKEREITFCTIEAQHFIMDNFDSLLDFYNTITSYNTDP